MSRDAALRRLIRLLEQRWKDSLPAGRIPGRMLKVMIARPEFQKMLAHLEEHGALPFPDRDFHPGVVRAPDGTYQDLMFDELGFDPSEFVCIDCGDEISRGQRRCDPCSTWRETGVTR